jgi:hypothetical protein
MLWWGLDILGSVRGFIQKHNNLVLEIKLIMVKEYRIGLGGNTDY